MKPLAPGSDSGSLPAIAPVFGEALEPLLEFGEDVRRRRARVVIHQVHDMRAVAEEHRARAVHRADDGAHRADHPRVDDLLDAVEVGVPAARVIHRKDRPVALDRRDHPVRVGQRRRERLLAEDRGHTTVGGIHDDCRVLVVRRADAEDVNLLALQHLPVIAVDVHLAPCLAPLGEELLRHRGHELADRDDARIGDHRQGGGMGVGQRVPPARQ